MKRIVILGLMLLKIVIAGIITAAFAAVEEPTYAERLGWDAGERVLIVHADDAGMSLATNLATIETLEDGVVNSVSVMMPTPWVSHWRDYMDENPDVDMGLHLTLTSEWAPYRWRPVAGTLPGLLDPDGYMWSGVGDVLVHASPDEVEQEIRAQIELARRMDLSITHLDSHMGTLFEPEFIERYVEVGIKEQIPVLMPGPTEAERRGFEWVDQARAMAERVWKSGLPVIDYIHTDSYGWKTTDKVDHYVEAIRNLEPGITQMIVHPTKPDTVVDVITGGREHLYGDYHALVDPRVKETLEEEDIILTTWRELMERRREAGVEENTGR
ncbi:MAG: polysaccharide deacetylase family protein [Bacteroidales bacterium]